MLADVQAESSVIATRQSFALTFCWINLNPKRSFGYQQCNHETIEVSKPNWA